MYYIELVQIELQRPTFEERKAQLSFLKNVSLHYTLLLDRNSVLQLYLKTQRTAEDNQLFVRNTISPSHTPLDPIQEYDTIAPPASIELARILAYEKTLHYLGDQIKLIKCGEIINTGLKIPPLDWTESKTALIELAYALHASKAINNGNMDIKRIISTLEQTFNLDLGNFYRTFQNIRIRQGSRTAFIDDLKLTLIQKMDEADLNF